MGKSPGKWLKTLLFGKKSSKSTAGKGREAQKPGNDKEVWITSKGPTAEVCSDSPSISRPLPVTSDRSGVLELETGVPLLVPCTGVNHAGQTQGPVGSVVSHGPERLREEQAVIKAQAAFRGYLARRAFRALRGIIRLQALVRGHLVRRQAIATLYCLHGIVKFQALVRGRRVRHSDLGLETYRKKIQGKNSEVQPLDASVQRDKLSTNAFICKLLAPSPTALPLRVHYAKGEVNSAWNWLERWTLVRFWISISPAKKVAMDPESQRKQGLDGGEPGRPKRNVRRNISTSIESSGSTQLTSENDKPKRNLRKVSSSPVVDSALENPQGELEKVKRNLRRVSASTVEPSSDRQELEPERPKRGVRKAPSPPSDVLDHSIGDSAEKMKKEVPVASMKPPEVESTAVKSIADEDWPKDALHDDQPAVQLPPSENRGNDASVPLTNGELKSQEDQIGQENIKTSKRRASLSTKADENDLPSTPSLPSYMAATESAKAKLRGQGSPRFGSDATEKNGFTRRHSLPTSTNGKVNSPSMRSQRLVQGSGKGGNRSDRSLLSSRDGNEKVITEWRR
ncbi:protein IQ-DOMAIN 31-like [Aristolochia californica]|uniref:protein IQ-DOMAIN 31-like n=1 Tax=Aristolochia californica TaxID=171875 RepID=UPI0035E26B52